MLVIICGKYEKNPFRTPDITVSTAQEIHEDFLAGYLHDMLPTIHYQGDCINIIAIKQ